MDDDPAYSRTVPRLSALLPEQCNEKINEGTRLWRDTSTARMNGIKRCVKLRRTNFVVVEERH